MITYLIRFLKRVAILLPGIGLAYLGVHNIFPLVDRLLPFDAVSIFITYLIVAYGLIPAFLRLFRALFKPKHIPLYCTTPDGFANDPINNIGVVGTKAELISTMTKAGWYQADRHSLKNTSREVLSTFLRQSYKTAPFSALYLFGRSQDIGFQLPLGKSPLHRHHVRFWAVTYGTDQRYRDHIFFWQKHYQTETPDRVLWVGAVSKDTGFGIIGHNAQITHMIHPDTNAEREFLVQELQKTKLVKKTRSITVGKPYQLRNRVLTGYMNADGKVTICELQSKS